MREDIRITVFTPTYNRGNEECLGRCYRNLCEQTNKNFIWLIIDDGSVDGTEKYVSSWLDEEVKKRNRFEIQYVKKKNGGTHTGYNKAFDLCETELIFCLETDDELLPNAIQTIIDQANGKVYNKSIGLIFPAYYIGKKEIIGKPLPERKTMISYHDCYYKYKDTGDKFFVFKAQKIGNYRFPVFQGEKLCSTASMLLTVHGDYKIVNENIYNKSYLKDGYTADNPAINFAKSPKGFAYFHAIKIKEIRNFKIIIKSSIHYIGCSLLAGENKIISKSPEKGLTILLFPLGFVWFIYLGKIRLDLKNEIRKR